jgi:hypothetical protein
LLSVLNSESGKQDRERPVVSKNNWCEAGLVKFKKLSNTGAIDSLKLAAGSVTASASLPHDGQRFYTPAHLACRYHRHVESIRRMLRQGKLKSLVLGRRRLVPLGEVVRIESEGTL